MNTPAFKPQILVVDDDESMRFMMQAKLSQSGYAVTLAASGSHAVQILESGKDFDLILCDLKMPNKDGIDVIQFLRNQNLQTPMIIITGFPERDKIISAAQLGVQDVLVKPVRHQQLMRMIHAKLGFEDETQRQAA